MFLVLAFVVLVFLTARAIGWCVQKYQDSHGSGRITERLLSEGKLDQSVFAGALWTETEWLGHRRRRAKLAKEQRRILRDTKRYFRNEYLNGCTPTIYQYIIIFLVASVLGLVLETVYTFIMFGIVESRVGLVWGPFSPLYGVGAVLLTMCLWQVRTNPWWQVFLISAALGGTLEQCAGWSMEHFADLQSWTYLGLPDHITQWIAWRFLFMWGVIGLVWCKVTMPELIYRIGEPTTRKQAVVASLLTMFMVLDIVMTLACFWRAGQRHHGVPPQNPFEVYVDNHFDDGFMARRFENMSIGEDLAPADR